MKKILKRIGVIMASFALSIKAMALKVYATISNSILPNVQPAYGVPDVEPVSKVAMIATPIIILVIFLIGIIVYCIKSTSSVLKKLLVAISSLLVAYILIKIINAIFFK